MYTIIGSSVDIIKIISSWFAGVLAENTFTKAIVYRGPEGKVTDLA